MWRLLILFLIVIVIFLFLLNTPRTRAKTSTVPSKIPDPPKKLEAQETIKQIDHVPEKQGYVIMEHHIFNIRNRELHLVLYGRNLDAYVRGFWKTADMWTSIPQMETNVQLDYIPVFRNLAQEGDYIVYSLHHNVLIYKYHDKDMKIVLTNDSTLPFFANVENVKLNKDMIQINNRDYQIKNMKLI